MKELALPEIPTEVELGNHRAEVVMAKAKARLQELQLELDFLSKLNHDKM